MLASALLPLSFFFPILTSAALPPSFPWRPSNLGPPLAARQDDPTDYLQCQPFFAIADACLDRLTAAEQAAYDSEAPPTNACFCTKAVFDTGNSCEAALGANSTAQNGFTGQLAQFKQACISAGYNVLSANTNTALIPIPTVTNPLDDGTSETTSASFSQPFNTVVTAPSETSTFLNPPATLSLHLASSTLSKTGGSSAAASSTASTRPSSSASRGSASASASASSTAAASAGGGRERIGGARMLAVLLIAAGGALALAF